MSTEKTLQAVNRLAEAMERVEHKFKMFFVSAALVGMGSVAATAETEAEITEAVESMERGVCGVEDALKKAIVDATATLQSQRTKTTEQAAGGAQ